MKSKNIKKYLFMVLAIVLLITVVGCSSSKPKLEYDNKSSVADIKAHALTQEIENLAKPNEVMMTMNVCYDIESLKADNIVKLVRFNNGRYYSVTPIENGKYLFLLYSESNEPYYVVDGYLASGLANRDDFENIEVGMSRDEIIAKDSNAYVSNDYSYHRFFDNSSLTVKYESNSESQYVVSEYDFSDEAESVLDYLLPQDMDLIA